MPNSWFRLYYEFADDPKVQMMPEVMQRRLVMLFCERCKGETLHETQRAFHWRISVDELAQTKALFLQNGFIDEDWNLLNWNKRQFLSDSSTDRVRKHRQAKKQDETLHKTNGTFRKRSSAVTVTAPDTDTDTETESDKTPLAPSDSRSELPAAKVLGTLPLNDGTLFQITDQMISEWSKLYPAVDVTQQCKSMKGWCLGNPTKLKTRKGIVRFITAWLDREQNKGPRPALFEAPKSALDGMKFANAGGAN